MENADGGRGRVAGGEHSPARDGVAEQDDPHFTQRTHLHLGCGPRQLHSVPVWASPASLSESEEKVWAGGPHSVIGCGPPAHHSEKVMKSVAR